jgi:hypothetical protein
MTYLRNISTPIPEEAPATAAIHSFKTHVVNGKIHVTANASSTLKGNSARPPKLNSTGGDTGKGVLIVGGGAGAFQTVESLREVFFLPCPFHVGLTTLLARV